VNYAQAAESTNPRDAYPLKPFRGIMIFLIALLLVAFLLSSFLLTARLSPPDLTSKRVVVVDEPDAEARLRRAGRGCHARGPSTNHEDFEMMRFPAHRPYFSVSTSMPCWHKT
jgi:hypothetical protein